MTVSVNVRLDRFGRDALRAHLRRAGGTEDDAFEDAVRYYLGDSASGRLAWQAPRHYQALEAREELELELDEDLHGELQRESRRQRVTPDLLAMHALMYYLADLDSGRAAARLGDAMDRDAEA
jgi:hypothetical protein